jgi:hypothetical protein
MLYSAAGYLASAPKLTGGYNQGSIGAGLAAICRNAVIADLAENSSIILLGQYRDSAPETVLMGEVGSHVSGVRLITSDWAKIFHGGGSTFTVSSDNLANAVLAGGTTIEVSTALTSGTGGQYLTLGPRETTAAGESVLTETIYAASSGVAIAITGGAPNGGMVYDHSSDTVIGGYNQVHAVVVVGAKSLMKVYDAGIGLNPQLLPPKVDGLVDQWDSAQWRWYGGFGVWAQNRLYRLEVGSNRQVLGV